MKWIFLAILGVSSVVQAGGAESPETGGQHSEFRRYILFPYLDKGFRAVQHGDFATAEASYRSALALEPQSEEIRTSLANVLLHRNKHQEAIDILKPVMAVSASVRERFLFQFADLLNPRDADDIHFLVDMCTPALCKKIFDGIAHGEFTRGGPVDALEFLDIALGFIKGELKIELLSLKSAYDEQVSRWQQVALGLGEVLNTRSLRPEESLRYGFALLNLERLPELDQYLSTMLPSERDQEIVLRREAIMRAVAAGETSLALTQFKRLSRMYELTMPEREQYARLLVSGGDYKSARKLVRKDGERGCLLLVELAVENEQRDIARSELQACAQENRGLNWLRLAINLAAEDALKSVSFSGDQEMERVRALSNIYIATGRYEDVVDFLHAHSAQGLPPDLLLVLARSLEKERRYIEAAKSYEKLLAQYESLNYSSKISKGAISKNEISPDQLLDNASYLYLVGGDSRAAAIVLTRNFPFESLANAQKMNERLFSLIHELPAVTQKNLLMGMVDASFSVEDVVRYGDLWRESTSCGELASLISSGNSGKHFVMLARCYEPVAPGLSAYYYAQASLQGVTGIKVYQAYNYHYGGDYQAALNTWLELSRVGLDDKQAFAAALSALAAEDMATAEEWWRQADLKTDQWWFTGALIARAQGDQELSLRRVNSAIAASDDVNSSYLYARAMLMRERGNIERAQEDESVLAGRTDVTAELLAHLAFSSSDLDSESSAAQLVNALQVAPENNTLREQLVYIKAAEGRGSEAEVEIQKLLDGLDSDIPPVGASSDSLSKKIYAFQRMHESLSRRHRFRVGGWAGSGADSDGDPVFDGSPFNSRGIQLNYDYRLVDSASTGWGSISAYGRAIASESTNDDFSGLYHTAGVGLRWNPKLKMDTGVMAEISHRAFSEGVAGTDLMIRASADLLSAFSAVHDWHVGVDSWLVQQFYLDGAYWVDAEDYSLVARYSSGPQFKSFLKIPSTIQPYGFLQADYSRNSLAGGLLDEPVSSTSAGVGMAFHMWSGNSNYDAYRQNYSLKLEYQKIIDSNYFEGNGMFLKIEAGF